MITRKTIKTLKIILIAVLTLDVVACMTILAITPLETLTNMIPTPRPTATPQPSNASGGLPTATEFRFDMPLSLMLYVTANLFLMFAKMSWWVWPILILLGAINRQFRRKP